MKDKFEKLTEDLQRVFDDVYRSHKGRPVEEVKARLRDAWRRSGPDRNLSDPQLSRCATAISEGKRISEQAEKL